MLGTIHQLLSDLRCYRCLLGGHWYHVEVIVFDMVVSGWVRKPEPHEEITKIENWDRKFQKIVTLIKSF